MAIAVDASTPATKTGSTSSLTTAAFSPPAKSLIVAVANVDGVVDSLSQVFWAYTSSAQTSMTVTVSKGSDDTLTCTDNLGSHLTWHAGTMQGVKSTTQSTSLWWLTPIVFTGASSLGFGATGGGADSNANISDSYSSTGENSWGWFVYNDYNDLGLPTVAANETAYYSDSGNGCSIIVGKMNATTQNIGTTVNISVTKHSGTVKAQHIYFEVLAALPAFVQSNSQFSSSSLTAQPALAFTSNLTAGSTVVVFVSYGSNVTFTITDSLLNTYQTAADSRNSFAGNFATIFYAKNVTGGACSVTATASATTPNVFVAIYEFSGLHPTTPLDATALGSNGLTATDTPATTAATTTNPNEILFCGVNQASTFAGTLTAGTGFTMDQTSHNGGAEYEVVSSKGSYTGAANCSAGTGTSYAIAMATFSNLPPNTPSLPRNAFFN